MLKITETPMRGKVLLQLSNHDIVTYYKGRLIIYSENNYGKKAMIPLPMSILKKVVCKQRLLERLNHSDIRWAKEIAGKSIVFLYNDAIYRLDLRTQTIEKEFEGFRGRPFSALQNGSEILFGDYEGNPERDTVNIYKRDYCGKWSIAFSFAPGTIRHIHNIIYHSGTYYVLTGDENEECGIWSSEDAFSTVKPLLIGSQQYRCCQMLPTCRGIYYVTDAPSETNHLYMIKEGKINKICKVAGTGIYGEKFCGGLLYSTTVEPAAHAKNILTYWLSNQPGKGIEAKKTVLYFLGENGENEYITYYKHDGLPLRLMQYGTIHISNEVDGRAYYSPVCVKFKDNRIFKIEK